VRFPETIITARALHAGDEAGSPAAGPKPGRISFTPKLGAVVVARQITSNLP
jgi:hypothetical protein